MLQMQVSVRRIMVEMENGDLVSFVPEVLPVAEPVVAEVEMTPDPVAEVVTPEPEVVPEPVAEAIPAEPEAIRRGGRKLKQGEVIVEMDKCKGVIWYEKKDGTDMDVAIYKHGKKKNGKPWYLCLFISKDGKWAYGTPWFAAASKIIEIEWFN
jgi:hypothetical protein